MAWFWKLVMYPFIFLLPVLYFCAMYLGNTVFRPDITEVVAGALEIDVSSAVVQKDEQVYGRGYRVFAELSFDGDAAEQMEQKIADKNWMKIPLAGGLRRILERELKAQSPLEEGYYYFENLSDDTDDPPDASFAQKMDGKQNFELAVYDTEADTLYYYSYLET